METLANPESSGMGDKRLPWIDVRQWHGPAGLNGQLNLSLPNSTKSCSHKGHLDMFVKCGVFISLFIVLFHRTELLRLRKPIRFMGKKGLYDVPKDMQGKEYITEIDFQFNFIKSLKSSAFSAFPSLKKLNFASNFITSISATAFSGAPISELNLQLNQLKCTPNLASIAESLLVLILRRNQVGACKQDTKYAVRFTKLTIIDLYNNDLTYLPSIVLACDSLRELNLHWNKLTSLPNLRLLLPSLFMAESKVDLTRNTYICDCDIWWMKAVELQSSLSLLESHHVCTNKGLRHGKQWRHLEEADFPDCNTTLFLGMYL